MTPTPPSPDDARARGLRLLTAALAVVGAFAALAGGWIAWQAAQNPDVLARRPRWLDEGVGFEHAFWSPLLLTVVGGAVLVALVFVRAFRRLRAGEDLYAGRFGRGVRRRGERGLDEA